MRRKSQIMEQSDRKIAKRELIGAYAPTHRLMDDNQLVTLSKRFAVDVIEICDILVNRKRSTPIISQLLRSGTSIGANIYEGNYAASKADFINKFQIALKECYETDYWLDIFHASHMLTDEEYNRMFVDCSKIRKLLIASITTAKKKG